MTDSSTLQTMLELSHFLGAESRELAILGEGNASAKLDDESFLVKASGSCLETLTAENAVQCRFDSLLPILDEKQLSDDEIETRLLACRVDSAAKKPSVETLFHAYLLSLPDIGFVGHTHSVAINQILCSPMAETFASRRMFPDEVVCCGTQSALVPYVDPGLRLSLEIREKTEAFQKSVGTLPRIILLQNHGVIAIGKTAGAVKAAMQMAHKAATIFVGAASMGGPSFMSEYDVLRIAGRTDEHYRQKALQL